MLAGLNDTVARFGPDDMFGRLIGPTLMPLYQRFDAASGTYRLHWDGAATRAGGDFTLQLVHMRGDWEAFDAVRACQAPGQQFLRPVVGASGAVLTLPSSLPAGVASTAPPRDGDNDDWQASLYGTLAQAGGYYPQAHPRGRGGHPTWPRSYAANSESCKSYYRLPWPTNIVAPSESVWSQPPPASSYPPGVVTCIFGDSQARTDFVGFMRAVFGVPQATTKGETKQNVANVEGEACTRVPAVNGTICYKWSRTGDWGADRLDECDAAFLNMGNHQLAEGRSLDELAEELGRLIDGLPVGPGAPRIWWLETPPLPGALPASNNCRANPRVVVANLVARRLVAARAPHIGLLPTFAAALPIVDAASDGAHLEFADVWLQHVAHTILGALNERAVPRRGRTPGACTGAVRYCRAVAANGSWLADDLT